MKDNGFMIDKKERKLTQLMGVDKFTAFSSYHLWLLMDRCHFVIDDIDTILVFSKHDGFRVVEKNY